MSELQAALLIIGLGVIVSVYLYGSWQQRRYRRRFGSVFKASHADALYQQDSPEESRTNAQSSLTAEPEQAHAGEILDVVENPANLPATSLLDDSCLLLDARSDFIIELHLAQPGPAGALDGLWQRKFDFRKAVQVCGLRRDSKTWERAIMDSPVLYERFRVSLQLVDRGGAISEARLADFRDLVLGVATHIKADASVPDIRETHHRAVELDAFCAEVDQMAGINLVPPAGRLLAGARISQAATLMGMTLEADGGFHLLDVHGHSLFSLVNQDGKPFQHLSLDMFRTEGVTLLLDIPRVENPDSHFDEMIRVACELAKELQAKLVDDNRIELTDAGLTMIREKIGKVAAKMREHGIEPGSAQALRLFS